jgi:DNA-binding transcriptional LysR family regulator
MRTLNLSLRQIRAFIAIARLQSFTRAAEQLHITQAGLSSMVRDAEQQLDCRLFDRTTRAVSLTAQGRAFLPVATRVLEELDDSAASLGRMSSAANGSLAIGATPLVASSLLPVVCASFAREHPNIAVSVHDLERSRIQEQLQAGQLDAGYGVFLETATGVRRAPVYATRLLLVHGRDAFGDAAASVPIRWRALATVPLLSLPVDNPIQRRVDKQLISLGRANEVRRSFNHLHTLLAMVESGAGCALLPSFIAAAAWRYKVGLRPVAAPQVDFDFFEITKTGRPRSAVLASFSAHLVAALEAAEKIHTKS